MGVSALATIIATVAAKLLAAYWDRTDQTDAARYRVLAEQRPALEAAALWLEAARADPGRAAALGLLPGAKGLRLIHPDDPAPGGPR